jgi:hypothetical protein
VLPLLRMRRYWCGEANELRFSQPEFAVPTHRQTNWLVGFLFLETVSVKGERNV